MDVEQFAAAMLDRHRNDVDQNSWKIAHDAFNAGEFEVSAIILVEGAEDVTSDEVDDFLEVAKKFDGLDAQLAPAAATKARQRLHAA